MATAFAEFHTGQVVPFPDAPDGVAQIDGLLRSNVEVLYVRCGRVCRRRVAAAAVAAWCRSTPLLPGIPANPMRRGTLTRTKRFPLPQ